MASTSSVDDIDLTNANGPVFCIEDRLRDLGVIVATEPRNPLLATTAARIETYSRLLFFFKNAVITLAEAGFFCIQDTLLYQVRCFHCDTTLGFWEAEQNPWEQHARWYPYCNFMLLVKGQQFIDAMVRSAIHCLPSLRGEEISDDVVTRLMQCDVCLPVLEIFEIEKVRNAIVFQLETSGVPFTTPQALMEAIICATPASPHAPGATAGPVSHSVISTIPDILSPEMQPFICSQSHYDIKDIFLYLWPSVYQWLPASPTSPLVFQSSPTSPLVFQSSPASPTRPLVLQSPPASPTRPLVLQSPPASPTSPLVFKSPPPSTAKPLNFQSHPASPTRPSVFQSPPASPSVFSTPDNIIIPNDLAIETNDGTTSVDGAETSSNCMDGAGNRTDQIPFVSASRYTKSAEESGECETTEKLLPLYRELQQLRAATLCKVCMESEILVVFLPCNHYVVCGRCAIVLKSCPVCRRTVQALVRTYPG